MTVSKSTASKPSNAEIQAHKSEIKYVLSGLQSIDRRNSVKWLASIAFTVAFVFGATYIVVYHQDLFSSKKGILPIPIPFYDTTTAAAEETAGTHWFVYVIIGLIVFMLFNKLFTYLTYTIDSPLIQRSIMLIARYNIFVSTMIPFILVFFLLLNSISMTDFVIAYVLNALLLLGNIISNFQPEFKINALEGEHVVEFWPQYHLHPAIMKSMKEIQTLSHGMALVDGLNGVVFKEDVLSQTIKNTILVSQEKHFDRIKKIIDDMAESGDTSTIYMFGENVFDTLEVPFFHENYGTTNGETPEQIVEKLLETGAGKENAMYDKAMTVWGAIPFAQAYAKMKGVKLEVKKTITDPQRKKLNELVTQSEGFKQWISTPGLKEAIRVAWATSDRRTTQQQTEIANYLSSTPEGMEMLYTLREAFALDNISKLNVNEGDKIILQFGKNHMFDAWNQMLRSRSLGFIIDRVSHLGSPISWYDRTHQVYQPEQNPRNVSRAEQYLNLGV